MRVPGHHQHLPSHPTIPIQPTSSTSPGAGQASLRSEPLMRAVPAGHLGAQPGRGISIACGTRARAHATPLTTSEARAPETSFFGHIEFWIEINATCASLSHLPMDVQGWPLASTCSGVRTMGTLQNTRTRSPSISIAPEAAAKTFRAEQDAPDGTEAQPSSHGMSTTALPCDLCSKKAAAVVGRDQGWARHAGGMCVRVCLRRLRGEAAAHLDHRHAHDSSCSKRTSSS